MFDIWIGCLFDFVLSKFLRNCCVCVLCVCCGIVVYCMLILNFVGDNRVIVVSMSIGMFFIVICILLYLLVCDDECIIVMSLIDCGVSGVVIEYVFIVKDNLGSCLIFLIFYARFGGASGVIICV